MTGRAQSIVEFALVAPVVILPAMATWAARDGARVAATAFGGAPTSLVQDAVLASAQAELPSLTSQMITISLPPTHSRSPSPCVIRARRSLQ